MMKKRNIIAIVPAAGVGSRMQADRPKQYLTIAGKTVLEHTLQQLLTYPAIQQIIVAVAENDPYIEQISLLSQDKVILVTGGERRDQSVLNALNAADPKAWALVHDAARPCITHQDLDKLVAVQDKNGAILATPVIDTIKRAGQNYTILQTEDRSKLWRALTPQFFPVAQLKQALQQAQTTQVTDEASAMELAGFKPHLIEGRSDNIKITRPEDLALATFYLAQQQRIG